MRTSYVKVNVRSQHYLYLFNFRLHYCYVVHTRALKLSVLVAGVRNALPEPTIDIKHRERATARAVDDIVGRAGWLRSGAAPGRCRAAGCARTALAEGKPSYERSYQAMIGNC